MSVVALSHTAVSISRTGNRRRMLAALAIVALKIASNHEVGEFGLNADEVGPCDVLDLGA